MRSSLFLILFLPIFAYSQKIQDLKIKEARLMYNTDDHLYAGKRLPIGLYIQAYKKKPDKYKEFRTPKGYYGNKNGNIGWGEFVLEITGAKFSKSKSAIVVDENIDVEEVKITITNRFNPDFKLEKVIPVTHGGNQRFVIEAEEGSKGRRGGSGGVKNVGDRENNIALHHGEDGKKGGEGRPGDSLEIFVTVIPHEEYGELVQVHLINKTQKKEYKRKFNPNKSGVITIVSKGGKGGRGGKGGNGSRSGTSLGRAGDGGDGGDGGPGGFIIMYLDSKAEKYRDRIFLESEGGDPGEHGLPGAPARRKNYDGKYEYGKRGGAGLNGEYGSPGPKPVVKVIDIEME